MIPLTDSSLTNNLERKEESPWHNALMILNEKILAVNFHTHNKLFISPSTSWSMQNIHA